MRKSLKKSGGMTTGTTLQLLTKNSKEEKSARLEGHSLLGSKYTRSISTFANYLKETPDKKKTIFHQKIRSTLNRNTMTPVQNITNVFANVQKTYSEEELLRDISDRFHVGKQLAMESSLTQDLLHLVEHLQKYIYEIIDHILTFQRQKLLEYERSVSMVCLEYEQKIRNVRKETMDELQSKIIKGENELGMKFMTTALKSSFSSKIFNQMEKEGIDVQTWICNSQVLNKFVNKAQYGQSLVDSQILGQQSFPRLEKHVEKVVDNEIDEFASVHSQKRSQTQR